MRNIKVKELCKLPLQYISDGDKSFFSNGKNSIGGFNTWKKKPSSKAYNHGKIAGSIKPFRNPLKSHTQDQLPQFQCSQLFHYLGIDNVA